MQIDRTNQDTQIEAAQVLEKEKGGQKIFSSVCVDKFR